MTLNALGFIFLALAAIAALLPFVPATPFAVIAASCVCTSNPRLYAWLTGNRYFGEYVSGFTGKTGLSGKARNRALLLLWLSLTVSAIFAVSVRSKAMLAALAVTGICMTLYVLGLARVSGYPEKAGAAGRKIMRFIRTER